MKAKIQSIRSKIYISYNIWISLNSLAILSIITYYIDEERTLQYTNLALKSIIGDYTKESLVIMIIEVLKD